jgi:ribosome-associated translation inhibitor RaiA
VVRLGDVNGPRGGVDKHCRITVSGRRFGSSTLDELDGDAYAAVDLATGRIARAIRRQLQRVRQLDPGGPSSRGVS